MERGKWLAMDFALFCIATGDSFRFYHTIEYEDMCACICSGVFLVDFCWRVHEMKALCADLGSIL